MRLSQFHLRTVKETPADAEIVSHQLMLKAGMVRKLAAGLYTWSPLGLRVLRKVEKVVREEMDRSGAVELLMPTIQPRELWEETGRWEKFGPQLLKPWLGELPENGPSSGTLGMLCASAFFVGLLAVTIIERLASGKPILAREDEPDEAAGK